MTAVARDSVSHPKYDRRSLTYSNSFENPFKRNVIRAMEWLTGKITILRLIREFERRGAPQGEKFWAGCLDVMGIEVRTPEAQIARIPKDGPVILVANHPHGMVDGMVLADLIGRRRVDYRVLSRSLLTGIDEVASSFLLPVPFPHEADSQKKSMEMRALALEHLKSGGLVCLFPSGAVAASHSLLGPAIEADWNVFTAQLVRKSGAQVVPVCFQGSNSRWYQIANRVSATLRQGLLLHEIVHALNKPQAPVIGEVIPDERTAMVHSDPRGFMAWLRQHTLSLAEASEGQADGETDDNPPVR
ncbi:MAG: lysophospholipid acyltransferase family protein [Pseudooceanicola sp.]|nr:lysophospholipid acyltransferase family protein [Pseudooceanicola sp.]MDF1855230.1 lysophospholipid acyltransferase family protein [Pseudooceanicola sp.]